MTEIDIDIMLSSVTSGMRLKLNAMDCLNPSMAQLSSQKSPVTCQVLLVQPDGAGYLVESVGNLLFRYPSDRLVKRLVTAVEPSDGYKPQSPPVPTLFKGVSIE